MSCIITSPETILTIARAIARISASGLEDYGAELPPAMRRALKQEQLYSDLGAPYVDEYALAQALYDMNVRAWYGRYEGRVQRPVDFPDWDFVRHAFDVPRCAVDDGPRGAGRMIYAEAHFRLAGALDFLTYQCDEDATRGETLLAGLIALADSWRAALVCADPRYRYGG